MLYAPSTDELRDLLVKQLSSLFPIDEKEVDQIERLLPCSMMWIEECFRIYQISITLQMPDIPNSIRSMVVNGRCCCIAFLARCMPRKAAPFQIKYMH